MRRLLRILLNAATVLSFVLCVVTVAAWVRSYQASDYVYWSLANPRLELGISTYRGGLNVKVSRPMRADEVLDPPGAGWHYSAPSGYWDPRIFETTFLNRLGLGLVYYQANASANRLFACPYWFIILLTATLPAARLARWRRRARRLRMHPELCQHCGYDCRATPDRCPECGRVPCAADTA